MRTSIKNWHVDLSFMKCIFFTQWRNICSDRDVFIMFVHWPFISKPLARNLKCRPTTCNYGLPTKKHTLLQNVSLNKPTLRNHCDENKIHPAKKGYKWRKKVFIKYQTTMIILACIIVCFIYSHILHVNKLLHFFTCASSIYLLCSDFIFNNYFNVIGESLCMSILLLVFFFTLTTPVLVLYTMMMCKLVLLLWKSWILLTCYSVLDCTKYVCTWQLLSRLLLEIKCFVCYGIVRLHSSP